jgi:hypothetical protein
MHPLAHLAQTRPVPSRLSEDPAPATAGEKVGLMAALGAAGVALGAVVIGGILYHESALEKARAASYKAGYNAAKRGE